MNIDVKILNQMLAKQIQIYIKIIKLKNHSFRDSSIGRV